MRRLIDPGHLARDGDNGKGVQALLVAVTDGLGWIRDHFLALVPWAVQVLDAHHAWKHIRDFAAAVWGTGTKAARAFLGRAYRAVYGRYRKPRRRRPQPRKGHKKHRATKTFALQVARRRAWKLKDTAGAGLLIDLIKGVSADEESTERDALLRYVENNADRMDYAAYTRRGWQLGSGAMESLHRTASQIRMRRPGPGWLPETSAAIFNLRMLDLVGRWRDLWDHPPRRTLLLSAFRHEEQNS